MRFSLNITDWAARAPGLSTPSEWMAWARGESEIDASAPQAKLNMLPMMTARRLSSGSRLAVECGMTLLKRHSVDAILFTSRHGELERNFRILQALATGQDISPTDFAMSVHNSAVGNLTIASQQPLVSSSLSAGKDSFQQGLLEILAFFQGGYSTLLMVDFEGTRPEFYHPVLPDSAHTWPYASAFVLQAGQEWHCEAHPSIPTPNFVSELPQSLQFLRGYLNSVPAMTLYGSQHEWRWSRT